ncbi:methyltransferase domain-containing protein [Rhodonellum sp.]|uniref:methyltransferase domain-containing protein n=1 Tax=Rhodonellum sp. TaxID=2231180 RepID=UPI002723E3B5|nr:methyltransferase domain-containing protein [Rhodonellum sp.]MDO9554168.1 methyltransferase domain-containing protein [Rhodonellum sp.]
MNFMLISLEELYWSTRYLNKETGWDLGSISTPLKQYLDQILNFQLSILVPGAGNGHEASYAFQIGFENLHILDISPVPLGEFLLANPDFPKSQCHHENFFAHDGQYDLILEQTFFCALPPEMRSQYAAKMHALLKPGGKLVGVLFNRDFQLQGPPFGGSESEYLGYFQGLFHVLKMEACKNSIPARQGSEFFFVLQKPQ